MKKVFVLLVLVSITQLVSAQRFHVGAFGGLAAYNGDIVEKIFPKKTTNGAIGITLNYELTDKIMLRAGWTYAVVGGADRYSKDQARLDRNLSFETIVREFSIMGEYYLQDLYDHKITPYGFLGVGVFHFNPYTYAGTSDKIYLRPLSTEGQGIAGYPDRKVYKKFQPVIPVGAGVKYAINNNLHVGAEFGLRVTFTDYLDDISKTFIDPNDLLAARGELARDISYRGDEVGLPDYPVKDYQRGSPKYNDFYYFAGLHLTYRIGGNSLGRDGKRSTGCPKNIY